ncbi:GNAT family N-acetyltransferase [Deinococcus lacus]|uniref:GNAT family N-acetyltransferase n=1 Tax=Deinococcus lacus TaxID=392561 RepID=A0ABW1YFJ0_9DEIO
MPAGEAIKIIEGYELRPITKQEYEAQYNQSYKDVFQSSVYEYPPAPVVPLEGRRVFTFGIFHGDEVVGWHRARQADERTINMSVTGLLPAHQGKGIYTRLLPLLLEHYREAGFTFVTSQHQPTNNAVIIPKLRAGFVIQGMSMRRAGMMVQLLYSFDKDYCHYLEELCGHKTSEPTHLGEQ